MSVINLRIAQKALDPKELHLIVLPTEQCNFRCSYCYEDFAIGKMQRPVIDGLKRLLSVRADDLGKLYISWFGGEPMLALAVILEINSFAKSLFEHSERSFGSGMTTNGHLLNLARFNDLLEVGVRDYQITLDGPKEIHDKSRKRADGSSTFDTIWNNLLKISSLIGQEATAKFHIGLRIHYDGQTAYELAPLVNDICEYLNYPDWFSVHFHEISKLGGKNDKEVSVPTLREHSIIDDLVCTLNQKSGLRFTNSTSASVAPGCDPYICYAARANSLVVRADGRLGKCTVALSDTQNDIGRLLPDGTLEISQMKLSPWLRGIFNNDKADLACPWGGMSTESSAPIG